MLPPRTPLRIAHRGMPRRARENTLASFALALAAGATGIELDVHATTDRQIVVHHDPALPDGASIADLTLAELGKHESAPDNHIPTLQAVCSLVKGRAELFVEIKGVGIEREVIASLATYTGALALHSFDHAQIQRISLLHTGHRLGILVEKVVPDIQLAMRITGALDVWPLFTLVTPRLVDDVHAAAGRVLPWTVNEPADAARLTMLGVDGICTDDVTIVC